MVGDRRRGDPAGQEFLPGIAGDAGPDPRAEVIVGDGINHVRPPPVQPSTPSSWTARTRSASARCCSPTILPNCARILSARGVIVNQCGVPAMQADELRKTSRRAKFFPHVSAYVAAVPTYVGGFMALGWAGKDAVVDGPWADAEIRARADAAGHARHHGLLDAGDPCRRVQAATLYRAASAHEPQTPGLVAAR